MKSSVGKLYMLLSACQPFDSRTEQILLTETVMEMPEYRKLAYCAETRPYAEKYYSAEYLKSLSPQELSNIRECIPVAVRVFGKLMTAVKYYDISSLKPEMTPDLYSEDKLKSLEKFLSILPAGVNYTNLEQGDFEALFSETTLKTEMDLSGFTLEELQSENLDGLFAETFSGRKYCFSENLIIQRIIELCERSI